MSLPCPALRYPLFWILSLLIRFACSWILVSLKSASVFSCAWLFIISVRCIWAFVWNERFFFFSFTGVWYPTVWIYYSLFVLSPVGRHFQFLAIMSNTAVNILFFILFYLFIWLHMVLVVAQGLFNPHCGMWDLVLWPGIEPKPAALGVWSPSHWTTGGVPCCGRS